MQPNQLNLFSPEQAALLLRKKRFWKKIMSISLTIGVLLVLASVSGTVIGMIRAFNTLKEEGSADPSELAGDISVSMLTTLYSLPLISLAFLIALVSFIRLLSLPKSPTPHTHVDPH